MLELTEKRLSSALWILENKEMSWSIYELNKGTAAMAGKTGGSGSNSVLTYKPTFNFVKELEKHDFLVKSNKTSEYSLARATDLIKLVSLARPVTGIKAIGYHSPIGFEKTLQLANKSHLDYSFTVFAGSELYRSYVKTDQIHVYVMEWEEKKWEKYLLSKKCLKAEKKEANLFLLPTKNEALLKQAKKVKGFSIAPTPILLSDLISFGGLAEEQGRFLMNEWLENRM
ncbi:MAG: hypothetical protein NUV57_04985 [archaeon]|nr:hypothetical protein [archaeon]